jgi:hypothetical protein
MRHTLKIGESSALGRVSVSMLRHHEKLGLLEPADTDAFIGYRYYELDQLPRLNRVIAFKELGSSLETLYESTRPFVVDSSRIERELGLKATPVDVGLQRTVEWYRRRAVSGAGGVEPAVRGGTSCQTGRTTGQTATTTARR